MKRAVYCEWNGHSSSLQSSEGYHSAFTHFNLHSKKGMVQTQAPASAKPEAKETDFSRLAIAIMWLKKSCALFPQYVFSINFVKTAYLSNVCYTNMLSLLSKGKLYPKRADSDNKAQSYSLLYHTHRNGSNAFLGSQGFQPFSTTFPMP